MKITIVNTTKQEIKADFPSLRCALEWAKNNQINELKLEKIIVKPLDNLL